MYSFLSMHFNHQPLTILAHKVGSGSGYTCAIFHHLVSPADSPTKGKVVGIEHIKQLVDWSIGNLKRDGLQANGDEAAITVICGDGRKGTSIVVPCLEIY